MTGVLLALAAATAYGTSDFVGGLASRRTTPWPVALLACVGATLVTAVAALWMPGQPTATDWAWGVLAGVGSGTGSGFLYRGFASGRMGVVAPLSGVGTAVLPVVVGVATGERPGALAWLGLLLAVPGIWLVSREEGSSASAVGIRDGALAGAGFGLLLTATGQLGPDAGLWPLTVAQAIAVAAVVLVAGLLGGDPRPRSRNDLWGVPCGIAAGAAMIGFLAATRHTLMSIAAVVSALYPAVTILLATTTGERLHRAQALGLALCGLCVVLVSLG